MNALIFMLFFIPGMVVEYLREKILPAPLCHRPPETTFYQFLRAIAYNIPLTIFEWVIIWIWKVPLGHDIAMISSLLDFWDRAINQVFLLKYCIVLLVGIGLYALGFYLYNLIRKCMCRRHPSA